MSKKIAIIGSGGFAKEVIWLLDCAGRKNEIACLMEPDQDWKERTILDIPVRPQSEFDAGLFSAVLAIADPRLREKVVGQLPANTEHINLIHPSVQLGKSVQLGVGIIIQAGCVVTEDIVLGDFVQLNAISAVGHDAQVGAFTTTASHVALNGETRIGRSTYWGTGSSVRQGLTVCDQVVVGMGAAVTKSILEPGVYAGVPAVKIK